MTHNRYETMSNSEINIKMTEMEKEYEALKNKIKNNLDRMKELDEKYIQAKTILEQRTRGKV